MSFCKRSTIHMNVEDIKSILNKITKLTNLHPKRIEEFSSLNISHLERNHYLLTFKTNGSKFFLFLTSIKGKKYSLFISYDNPRNMIVYNVKLRFDRSLYNDTLIDGELLINDKNNWIFMMNNILYIKKKFVGNLYLGKRIKIMSDILRKEYKFDDFLNPCHLQLRSYFLFNHLEMLSRTHNNQLLLIPEKPNNKTFSITIKNLTQNLKIITNLSMNYDNKKTEKFFVKSTNTPDVFKLYKNQNINIENFKGIACISSKRKSFYMKKLFDDSKEEYILINFEYNNHLKGWEPIIENN